MKKQKAFLLSLSIVCTITSAMEKYDKFIEQAIQKTSEQQQIRSLLIKKRIADSAYATLVVGTAAATICNVIWEEPTLNSDYTGAGALSVANKINTALTLGLSLVDIMWLLKPYCAFSSNTAEESMWSIPMLITHISTGSTRAIVAGLVGLGAGIRRYPHTMAILTINALSDLAGSHNAIHHMNIDTEIDKIQSKAQ